MKAISGLSWRAWRREEAAARALVERLHPLVARIVGAHRPQRNAAFGNWKAITPEVLLQPENADLLNELRILAKDPRQTQARVP